jgi:hypothetical protein
LILLRLSAQWIYSKQGWDNVPDRLHPTWLDIGFLVADVGGIFFLLALAVGGVGVTRMRAGKSGAGLLKVTMVIALALIAAYVVAVWAMTGKPQ